MNILDLILDACENIAKVFTYLCIAVCWLIVAYLLACYFLPLIGYA